MSLRAGKRDTVASDARRYRVSAQQVAQWNRTSASATFARGQTVVVCVPNRSAARHVAASRTRTNLAVRSRAPARVVASATRTPVRGNAKAKPAVSRGARVRVASAR